jgi:hypothetical protein
MSGGCEVEDEERDLVNACLIESIEFKSVISYRITHLETLSFILYNLIFFVPVSGNLAILFLDRWDNLTRNMIALCHSFNLNFQIYYADHTFQKLGLIP